MIKTFSFQVLESISETVFLKRVSELECLLNESLKEKALLQGRVTMLQRCVAELEVSIHFPYKVMGIAITASVVAGLLMCLQKFGKFVSLRFGYIFLVTRLPLKLLMRHLHKVKMSDVWAINGEELATEFREKFQIEISTSTGIYLLKPPICMI